jgi:hypothetical protein
MSPKDGSAPPGSSPRLASENTAASTLVASPLVEIEPATTRRNRTSWLMPVLGLLLIGMGSGLAAALWMPMSPATESETAPATELGFEELSGFSATPWSSAPSASSMVAQADRSVPLEHRTAFVDNGLPAFGEAPPWSSHSAELPNASTGSGVQSATFEIPSDAADSASFGSADPVWLQGEIEPLESVDSQRSTDLDASDPALRVAPGAPQPEFADPVDSRLPLVP